jgi:hypothetical protein
MPKRRQCAHCVYLRKKASVDRWKEAHPEQVRHLARTSRYNRYGPARFAALVSLGGKCAVCGFSDGRCLIVDHVEGGGTAERQITDRVGFYQRIAAGQTDGLQLLCLNHERIKTSGEITQMKTHAHPSSA